MVRHPSKRGRQAIEHFGILTRFTGRLIHDCLACYFLLHCLHGLCNAHLLRELTFLFEVEHQRWAGAMRALLLQMHRCASTGKAPRAKKLASWQRRYRALVRQGHAANPPLAKSPTSRRGRPKQSKAQNLLHRLKTHQRSVLAFLEDPEIPFTNNQAEQDLRMMKVQQKISGAFRTLPGAQMFARIRSYLSTVRKQERDVFQSIIDALNGEPFLPRGPA